MNLNNFTKGELLMDGLYISVILPNVSDGDKLAGFLDNIFSQGMEVEALICDKIDPEELSTLDEKILAKVKVFPSRDKAAALKNAICDAEGEHILFSDVKMTYSCDAFSAMLARGACAFNGASADGNLFSADFSFDEIASKNGYFCCLMSNETIKSNQIMPVSATAFSIMNMIADYARYDEIKVIHESLFNISALPETSADASDIASLENYSWLFSQTTSDCVTIFYIRNVMSVFGSCEQKESFEMLKAVLLPFMGDYAVCAWFKEAYGWNVELLKTDISVDDFRRLGTDVKYTEVVMPIRAKDAVVSFYFGKFGKAVLKQCLFANLYYKAYCMKPGLLRDKLCEFFKHRLGGDFNA